MFDVSLSAVKKSWALLFIVWLPLLGRTTRDIVIDIDVTLITCCTRTQSDFDGTFTTLTALENLLDPLGGCTPTLIRQSDVGATGYVIMQSGVYQLAENIQFAPAAPASAITISADDVLLNLLCYSITQTNATAGVTGIAVNTHSDVTISGGALVGMTQNGISVASGSSNIALADTEIMLSNFGVLFQGTSIAPIESYRIVGLDITSIGTGGSFNFSNSGIVSECSIAGCSNAGLEFVSSFSNQVDMCSISDVIASTDAVGISAIGGGNNRFEKNSIDTVSTSATSTERSAVGVLIGATENNDTLANNQISNIMTSSNARPFGIEMQYTFTALSNSGLPVIDGSTVNYISWSNDGRYLAAGTLTQVIVYEFDGTNLSFIDLATTSDTEALSWSPDGSFLAAGSGQTLVIYSFSDAVLTVAATSAALGSTLNAVNWSSDGRFIATGNATSPQARVFTFNQINSTLTQIATFVNGTAVTSVDWSPDVKYLAIGSSTAAAQVRVLSFDGLALTSVATFNHGAQVNSVNWSSDGRNIAFGGVVSGGVEVRVLNFTGSALNQLAAFAYGATVQDVAWSPDNQYLAVGGNNSTVIVLNFTGNSLIQPVSFTHGANVFGVSWRPSGDILAFSGVPNGSTNVLRLLSGLRFPSGSIIKSNLVRNTNGPTLVSTEPGVSSGRGLSASSAHNLIIQNTAFANDINYVFVTDIFVQFLANVMNTTPSLIDNRSFPPL